MNIFFIIIALVGINAALLFRSHADVRAWFAKTFGQPQKIEERVEKLTDAPTETPKMTVTPSQPKATPTPTRVPTKANSPLGGALSSLRYPSTTVVSETATSLELDSTDSASDVTNWYTDLVKRLGMNATAIVKTNTNGNINNKLSANNGKLKIDIHITQSPGSVTHISVTEE